MKITVIGTGYVGLVTGTCFAELGNEVCALDINKTKIAQLKQGKLPLYEPGLEELVCRNQREGRLKFTVEALEAISFGDVIFSAVGTPPGKGDQANLKAVYAVAKTFATHVNKYTLFINKSTLPVGTSAAIEKLILAQLQKRGKTEKESRELFDLVDNPEFLREGSAVKDFLTPDRIVVGLNSHRAREIMAHLYHPLKRNGHTLFFTDLKNAEIMKYAANAFLATKISFINEIARFCEASGGNVREVARGIGLDERIGARFLEAGIGYGGSCFPKDIKAFIESGEKIGAPFKILPAVEAVNEVQKKWIVQKLKKCYPTLKGRRFAVWGLTFKPQTDDLREAPSLTIIPALLKEGATLHVFDPLGMPKAKAILGSKGITYAHTRDEALEGADALLILTEWDEFRSVAPETLKERLKEPLIVDGRNIYERTEMEKVGLRYIAVGSAEGGIVS